MIMPVYAAKHKVAGNLTHFSASPFCPRATALCPIRPTINAASEKVTESLMALNGQAIGNRRAARASNVASLSMWKTVYSVSLNGVIFADRSPSRTDHWGIVSSVIFRTFQITTEHAAHLLSGINDLAMLKVI